MSTNDTAQGLRKEEARIERRYQRNLLRIKERWSDPKRAFLFLAGLFLAIVIVYVIFIQAAIRLDAPKAGNPSPDSAYISWANTGFLEVEFNDAALERRYRRSKINEIKGFIERDLAAHRPGLLAQRKAVLDSAALVACHYYGGSPDTRLPRELAGLAVTRDVSSAGTKCNAKWFAVAGATKPSDLELGRMSLLPDVVAWFEGRARALPQAGSAARDEILARLKQQEDAEDALLARERNQLGLLKDSLSFGFLDTGGSWAWIFHLVVWSWFGVIASSLVGLSSSVINKTYDGLLFSFVFFKFILAPLIAIVVAAMIVYGITQNEIVLSHNPMLLVFAFLSGFFSERFTDILRQAANIILSGASVSKAKFDAVTNPPPRVPFVPHYKINPEPKTLNDLKRNLDVIGANATIDFARGLAARTADSDLPRSPREPPKG